MRPTKALTLLFFIVFSSGAGAQSRAEIALAKQVLSALQRPSIQQNVEYCGYLGYDRAGKLIASEPTRGFEATCLARSPRDIIRLTATYHTHGAFSRAYIGEMPSGDDMEGDRDLGIGGYVATPGGRLWYNDTTEMVTKQICGVGCLPRDGRFQRGAAGRIRHAYTYRQLVRRLSQ